jgi:cytochrome c biogenesis protein
MSSKEIASDLSAIDRLWKLFASVKLTIGLLLTLAATSIIGTLIPRFFDMYHSWWFRALILLLVVNIVVCSIDRLQATWKIIFARHPRFNPGRYRQLKNRIEYDHDTDAERLKALYQPIIDRRFRYHRTEETAAGFAIYGERGR